MSEFNDGVVASVVAIAARPTDVAAAAVAAADGVTEMIAVHLDDKHIA